jgi:hypothetical protein
LEDRQPLFQRTFGRDVRPATHGSLAGGGPAATHFSLYRQRKVSKRKATPLSASRSEAAGNLFCGGLARNRSNSAIASDNRGSISRHPPTTQAHTEGEKRIPLVALCATLRTKNCSAGSLRSNARQSRVSCAAPRAVMRRRVAQGVAEKGAQMFEHAGRVSAHPADPEQHSLPTAQRRDDAFGSPFFSVVFFGEAKKSASPAGARPGLPLQPKVQKILSTLPSPASATTGTRT